MQKAKLKTQIHLRSSVPDIAHYSLFPFQKLHKIFFHTRADFKLTVNIYDRLLKFFRMTYDTYNGGVLAATALQYKTANGFPNRFWGWGAEDDEFGLR